MTPDDGSDQDAGDPQSWNLYSYVRNNPAGNVDPDGHEYVWDDGSFDSTHDSQTGNYTGCAEAGGTWFDPSTFAAGHGQDWSASPNSYLAGLVAEGQSLRDSPGGSDTSGYLDLIALQRAGQNVLRQEWIQQQQQIATDAQRLQMLSLAGAQAAHDLGCAGVPTGLNATGTALFVAGQPVTGTKRFVTPGSSKGTYALSEYLRGKMDTSAEGIWAPTGGPGTGKALGLSATTDIGAATARWAPFIGLAANVVSVGTLVHCLNSHP